MKLILFIILLMSNILAYSQPITVGVLKFAPPFSSSDGSNHYYGFCIDLMNELCIRLNEVCQYKGTELDNQLNDLNHNAFDITFLPSPINPKLAKNYLFTLPYIASNGQFISLENANINSIDEIKNKKIGVMKTSLLKEHFLLAYTSHDKIIEYSKITDVIEALSAHEVDVILLNASIAKYFINNAVVPLHLIGKPIPLGNGYALISLKRNAALIQKVNKALLEIESDGTYLIIYNKYFSH